jgi:hypothetical protein
MSSMNPLRFFGGMILEIGAVIAVLAMLPAVGSRDWQPTSFSSEPKAGPNQVFYDARSSRTLEDSYPRVQPPAAWQSDLVSPPPAAQQRYVEDSLDNNGQRVLEAAARLWQRGDQLLPPDLQVRREPTRAPVSEFLPRGLPDSAPSHYSPAARRVDRRY